MTFADNLRLLSPVGHLAALHLIDAAGNVIAVIENKPGQAGSLAVYAALAERYGAAINAAAAADGLNIYAEHTVDAQAHPGKHPNIDRLIQVRATGIAYTVKPISA